jgi:hypothetical protein
MIRGTEGPLIAIAAVAFLALAGISLSGPRELVYDERYYVRVAVDAVHKYGLTTALLDTYPYPAGLPNAVLMAPLDAIGGLSPPVVRVYNLILLAAVIGLVSRLSRSEGGGLGWAGMTLGNPVAWVLFGLALTEPLAMAALAVAVAALRQNSPSIAAAGGLAFGVAVLSRPQLLVLVPVLPLFALCRPGGGWRAAICLAAAGAVCLPVFAYWRGLVSPAVPTENYSNQQLSAVNGLLACGYAGVMALGGSKCRRGPLC